MYTITSSDSESSIYDTAAPRNRNARGPTVSFPMKLHKMLDNAEQCGYQNIISWLPDGRSFKIHDPEGMVSILCMHFHQTRYKSFLRQIQNYGFRRVTRGPKRGVCSHEHFVRWDPLLCLQMKRVGKTSTDSLRTTMLSQGHCLKMATGGAPDHPVSSSSMKNEAFHYPINSRRNSVSIFSDITMQIQGEQRQQQYETEEDGSWLTRLLNNEDLWMGSMSNINGMFVLGEGGSNTTSANADAIFEPNPVSFYGSR